MKNGIIVPCYNEANRINIKAFSTFLKNHADYQICFVNDGSSDNTLEVLNELKAQQSDQVLIKDLGVNMGKSEAVRKGVQYVLENSGVDNIGFLDADLATGFEDYKRIIAELNSKNKCITAIGSRVKHEGIKRSKFRDFGSKIIGKMIQFVTKLPIQDTQCGAKVFKRGVAKQIFANPFLTRWIFDIEILIRIKKSFTNLDLTDQVIEVPLTKWEDIEGSKLTIWDGLKVPFQLIQVYLEYNTIPVLKSLIQLPIKRINMTSI